MQASTNQKKELEKAQTLYDSYNEELQSREWEAYRNFILTVKGSVCEVCGKRTWLQIHHKAYKKGSKAWEYLPGEVVVLCRDCHENIHCIPKNKNKI